MDEHENFPESTGENNDEQFTAGDAPGASPASRRTNKPKRSCKQGVIHVCQEDHTYAYKMASNEDARASIHESLRSNSRCMGRMATLAIRSYGWVEQGDGLVRSFGPAVNRLERERLKQRAAFEQVLAAERKVVQDARAVDAARICELEQQLAGVMLALQTQQQVFTSAAATAAATARAAATATAAAAAAATAATATTVEVAVAGATRKAEAAAANLLAKAKKELADLRAYFEAAPSRVAAQAGSSTVRKQAEVQAVYRGVGLARQVEQLKKAAAAAVVAKEKALDDQRGALTSRGIMEKQLHAYRDADAKRATVSPRRVDRVVREQSLELSSTRKSLTQALVDKQQLEEALPTGRGVERSCAAPIVAHPIVPMRSGDRLDPRRMALARDICVSTSLNPSSFALAAALFYSFWTLKAPVDDYVVNDLFA